MKLFFFGNNIRGVKCLEALIKNREEIIGIAGHPDKQTLFANEVKKLNYPFSQPKNVNSPEFISQVKKLEPDLFVLSGYNKILKKEILSVPSKGAINLHGGKLPFYRGVAPINWQIINGEKTGGCSVIYVDEGIDTGDIIEEKEYEITLEDDAKTILDKTMEIFPPLLLSALDEIKNNTVKVKKQNLKEGCYYCRRYPEDGKIKWEDMTAFQVFNLIRALVPPYPGAFTLDSGGDEKIIIHKASLLKENIIGIPGRLGIKKEGGVVVMAKDRSLLLELIQPEGNPVMRAREYFKNLKTYLK